MPSFEEVTILLQSLATLGTLAEKFKTSLSHLGETDREQFVLQINQTFSLLLSAKTNEDYVDAAKALQDLWSARVSGS